jgi:uncharacterized membrane protein (UPF0182 family)
LTAAAKKIFSYLLKASIVVLAFVFIYSKFLGKNDSLKQFEALISVISRNQVIYTLTTVVLLMVANWFLESLKWQYLAKKLTDISVWVAVEAVFAA